MSPKSVSAALPPIPPDIVDEPDIAVVINVHTELVTSVALASLDRHTDLPVLLVNLDPTDQSRKWFTELSHHLPFRVLEGPLLAHGLVLDLLLAALHAALVTLLYSVADLWR